MSRLACHPGARRTVDLLRQRFWWPSMQENVQEFVSAFPICNQPKRSRRVPAGLLQPLPVPRQSWTHIALDFVTGLPQSAGNTVILAIIDRFSKMAHFIPLPKLPSAKETAQMVIQHGL